MEIIPNGDFVFRLIPKNFIREFKISPSGFMLHPHDEHKLSVDWEKYSTPEASLARCGATLKKDNEVFKDHRSYEICKLKSGFIRSLNGIVDVLFDPIFNNPEHLGQPNNPSHSLIVFDPNDYENEPEIYQKLVDRSEIILDIDREKVEFQAYTLRSRWDM